MEKDKLLPSTKEIAEEIKGRRMIYTDTDWPDDTGDQFDEIYIYAYYTYADIPVRVLIDTRSNISGAAELDYKTGLFKNNNLRISQIVYDLSADAEKVTKQEFYKKCDEYMAYWTLEQIEKSNILMKKNMAWLHEQIEKKKEAKHGE